MRVLLLTPPMIQLNTPYPATAYLTGFLRGRGIDTVQEDLAIQLVLKLFSKSGLSQVKEEIGLLSHRAQRNDSRAVRSFLEHFDRYSAIVEPVIRFLQGQDPALALRISSREFIPEGPRFEVLNSLGQFDPENPDPIQWAFGVLGVQDRAKYLASLMVDDLADVIREGVDSRFELSKYGEKLAASQATFEPMQKALDAVPSLVDRILDQLTRDALDRHRPDVVGVSAPFPGNVYGAFRVARTAKLHHKNVKTILGGGYPNTELRALREPAVFDFFDFITLDDGERPFLCLLEHLQGKRTQDQLLRTFVRQDGQVVLKTTPSEHDIPHRDTGTPTYDGLPIRSYLSVLEMLNPMHRIWSDGRWNKLTLAHGCYWKKCNFCDINLDYIGRYDPASADLLVDRIEAIVRETGQSGFHFVDEAAPPAVLRALAERLIDRGVVITWWGNIRFEKTFTPELARLLARSGCVAVTGGLEVASDRLLKLMQKGVTVEQVARVTKAFSDEGVMVHAYLMYGFPTQTESETIDALERVRQLFEQGCLQSAYWHRFSATAHSPIGRSPEQFGIRLLPRPTTIFAENDLPFEDPTGCDHDTLGEGLRRAVYNFMYGVGLDEDVRFWFARIPGKKLPKPQVARDLIARALG